MTSRGAISKFVAIGALAALWLVATELSAEKDRQRPIPVQKTKFDKDAEKVELFAALKEGELDAIMIPKDEKQGQVLIQNMSDKPLTVQLPEGIVGVQVLKQFGGLGGGGLGGEDIGGGGGSGGGGAQPLGGGMGGGMMGGMGGMGMGGGFFSVPPEQIVSVPCQTVCMAHGKPTPNSRMRYRLVPVDTFTKDERLQELIKLIGTKKIDPQIAQAAAWHLTDNMSWRELAAKQKRRLGGLPPVAYFTPRQLLGAQQLVAIAGEQARERDKDKPEVESPGESPGETETSENIRRRR